MANLNQRLIEFARSVSEKIVNILQRTNEIEQKVNELKDRPIQQQPGAVFTPNLSESGDLSWTNNGNLENPSPVNIKGAQGEPGGKGDRGDDGATFTPSVSQAGELTWTNNKGLQNPPAINIKGPKGDGSDIVISDSVDSDSQTSVASSKAVKTAYDEAKNAKSLAEEKISAGTTLEHYGITDAVRQSDLEVFLRKSGQQTITGGDLEINNGDYSSVNLKNPTGKSARFEGRPDSDTESFIHFINKSATNTNLFRVKVPKENGTVALRPEEPIQIWAGNAGNGSEFNVSKSVYDRHLIIYLQQSSSHTLSDSNLNIVVSVTINKRPMNINGEINIYTGYYEASGWRNVKLTIVNEKRLRAVDLSGMFIKAIYMM